LLSVLLCGGLGAAVASPSRATGPTTVTDPIVLDTAEILHWTEQATAFDVDAAFADSIFTPPQASQ